MIRAILEWWRAYCARCPECHDTGTMSFVSCSQPYLDCPCKTVNPVTPPPKAGG